MAATKPPMTFFEFAATKPKPTIAPDAPVGDIGEAFALALKRDTVGDDCCQTLRDMWLNYAANVTALRRKGELS